MEEINKDDERYRRKSVIFLDVCYVEIPKELYQETVSSLKGSVFLSLTPSVHLNMDTSLQNKINKIKISCMKCSVKSNIVT